MFFSIWSLRSPFSSDRTRNSLGWRSLDRYSRSPPPPSPSDDLKPPPPTAVAESSEVSRVRMPLTLARALLGRYLSGWSYCP